MPCLPVAISCNLHFDLPSINQICPPNTVFRYRIRPKIFSPLSRPPLWARRLSLGFPRNDQRIVSAARLQAGLFYSEVAENSDQDNEGDRHP